MGLGPMNVPVNPQSYKAPDDDGAYLLARAHAQANIYPRHQSPHAQANVYFLRPHAPEYRVSPTGPKVPPTDG